VQVQPVKISRQIGGDVVIAAGVKGGDRIITEIPQALQPGVMVRLAGSEGKDGAEQVKGKGKKGKAGKKGDGTSGRKAEG
jgi:hypothetical protein